MCIREVFDVYSERYLKELVSFLVRNNLKWEINDDFPVAFVDKIEENSSPVAQIQLYELLHTQQGIEIHDLRADKTFHSHYVVRAILINKNIEVDEYSLTQILLHELCHWYTYENERFKPQPHGVEFKKYGRLLGVKPEYLKATQPITSGKKQVYVGLCKFCEQACISTKTRKDLMEHVQCDYSACCHDDIKFGGKIIVDNSAIVDGAWNIGVIPVHKIKK